MPHFGYDYLVLFIAGAAMIGALIGFKIALSVYARFNTPDYSVSYVLGSLGAIALFLGSIYVPTAAVGATVRFQEKKAAYCEALPSLVGEDFRGMTANEEIDLQKRCGRDITLEVRRLITEYNMGERT